MTVRQIAVPSAVRARSTLRHADYEDAFVLEIGAAQDRTAEQWARAILEDAPAAMRRSLRRSWLALGLKLGSAAPSDRFVLGWELRRSTPDFVLLGAGSRIGMPAELLLERRRQTLLLATFVQRGNPIARVLWASVEPMHQRVVPAVLGRRGRAF
jgi:hypothetical protein